MTSMLAIRSPGASSCVAPDRLQAGRPDRVDGMPLEQSKWIALPGQTRRLVMPIHQARSNFVKLPVPRQATTS